MNENEQILAIAVATLVLPSCAKRMMHGLAGHPISDTQLDLAVDESFRIADRFIERVSERYPEGAAQIRESKAP